MKIVKLRLPQDIYDKFKQLHPAWGEESRVMKELLEAYVRMSKRGEDQPRMYERVVESRKV